MGVRGERIARQLRVKRARAHWLEDCADHLDAVAGDTAADTAVALGVDTDDVLEAAAQLQRQLRRRAERTEPT